MFEFETKGNMNDLINMEKELQQFLGFKNLIGEMGDYPERDYEDVDKKFNVVELEYEHEELLEKENGSVYFLKHFPMIASPFWIYFNIYI